MRLLSFEIETSFGPEARVGTEAGPDRVLDLTLAAALMLERQRGIEASRARSIAEEAVPTRMLDFIAGSTFTLELAEEVLDWALKSGDAGRAWDMFTHGRRLAVLPTPPLIRDFMAFEEHLENIYPRLGRDIPSEWYKLPVYYKGNSGSVGAHGEEISIPSYCENFDFEFEFAAVIGRGGSDITEENALSHIYGYTIYNDFSARDIQAREMSVGLGPAKGKDFNSAHVFGPVLVTRDEIPDAYALSMIAHINGETWCETSSAKMHWRFEQMIAHASRAETLRVGEIFGSGTAGGGSKAERGEALSRGDTIALNVEHIGTLENHVV